MSIIRTEGLEKVYGSVHALDGLTLSIEPGVVFGFLGPNGAGKSTTMRLLTGLAKPTHGHVWIAGELVNGNTRGRGRIGYLPEEPAFYPWMTPVELLDFVGRMFKLAPGQRKQRTTELLALVGLAEVGKRRIGGFSRGMRQRLGLAQALVNQPEVLLLDEPVSALDPAGRKEVLELIAGLRNRCTVFMSTHILDDVERICDRVGIINHGKLVVEAPQAELIDSYSIPAFELACEVEEIAAFQGWIRGLADKDWVVDIRVNSNQARVVVTEVAIAREVLFPGSLQAGLHLRRYEIVTPTLEDIFLRLTRGDEAVAASEGGGK